MIAPTILEASWKRNGICKPRGFVRDLAGGDKVQRNPQRRPATADSNDSRFIQPSM